MSNTRRRFARIPLGYVDAMIQKVSPGAALLAVRLRLHPHKRSIPALLALGEAGLAESIDEKPSNVRR